MTSVVKTFFSALFAPAPIAIWLVFSMSVTLAGPFGTFEYLSYFPRLAYWSGAIGISIVFGSFGKALSRKRFPENQPIKQDTYALIVMMALFLPFLYVYNIFLLPQDKTITQNTPLLFLYVTFISAAVFVIRRLIPGVEKVRYLADRQQESPPRLLRRLPPDFVGPVVRLAVRDHFVDVVTPTKTHTIRMRFCDAIEEMAGVVGYCTHRSHWVVATSVLGPEQQGTKLVLRLVNGDVVPVSRKYRSELEAAGLV